MKIKTPDNYDETNNNKKRIEIIRKINKNLCELKQKQIEHAHFNKFQHSFSSRQS